MFVNNFDPVLLSLGWLEIRWYGLVFAFGFLFAGWWLLRVRESIGLNKEEVWDFIFYLVIGVVVGSRLFEIFWNPSYYLGNLFNIIKVWEGGLSFHGGLVGTFVTTWFYSNKKKLSFWKLADALSAPAILALGIGRIANFINGELWGKVWEGKHCVVFPRAGSECRHPYVLYEAVKRFLTFGWLVWLQRKNWKPGFITWNLVFLEGLGRFIFDFYKEDILYGFFTPGQWLSLVMVLWAGYMFSTKYKDEVKALFLSRNI